MINCTNGGLPITIVFFGHARANFTEEEKTILRNMLKSEIIKKPTCKFYLGGYGNFDNLCFTTLREFKKEFHTIELLLITPYPYIKPDVNNEYSQYDGTLFPPIESVPKRFAILKRIEWMVSKSNLLKAYVKYPWGGTAKTLEFAERKKIPYINLANSVH